MRISVEYAGERIDYGDVADWGEDYIRATIADELSNAFELGGTNIRVFVDDMLLATVRSYEAVDTLKLR